MSDQIHFQQKSAEIPVEVHCMQILCVSLRIRFWQWTILIVFQDYSMSSALKINSFVNYLFSYQLII